MKLTKQQSAEALAALQASGKTLKYIARKYDLSYSLFRYWIHGQTSADKFNLYLLYAAALKDEVGWDMFAEPEKNQEE
ncbi:MAG: hypothetical protein WCR87_09450 [Saccharofermentanales bacterium]